MSLNSEYKICIIGLGYVGLPLFVELSKQYKVIGFDINKKRVNEIKSFVDSTNEYSKNELKEIFDSNAVVTSNEQEISDSNVFIITVPTPVDEQNTPDLKFLKAASKLVAKAIKKNDIVIYESTVYPGVTEDECIKLIEEDSKLKRTEDFFFGYSPERINPGDKKTKLTNVTKLVSGCCEESLKAISSIYKSIIEAEIYECSSVKVAEAAKVIENVQRDVNIGLANEFSLIFNHIGIDTEEVIEAAGTKWNFMKFYPGMVGGHCIGVDPYYLIYKSETLGYVPGLIKTARDINTDMPMQIFLNFKNDCNNLGLRVKNILILGYTFKENCPDIRNTGVRALSKLIANEYGRVDIYDPYVPTLSNSEESLNFLSEFPDKCYDAIILAVPHKDFTVSKINQLKDLMPEKNYFYDLKSYLPKNKSNRRL